MNNPAIMYRSFTELKEWQAFMIETRILEEIYYPMWYHYNACISDHKDIAVYMPRGVRIECHNNPEVKGTMDEMICGFKSNGEWWVIGIKAYSPESDYRIGIGCPDQAADGHSIYKAMIHDRSAYDYSGINCALDTLRDIVAWICKEESEPQWLVKEATP